MKKLSVEIKGFWDIKLHGPDGKLKEHLRGQNVITTAGKAYLASFLHSAATSAVNTLYHVAIGTNSTAESASDTALGTELARTTGTASHSAAIYSVVATFPAGTGTGAIAEYGLFSSSSAGTMFSRDTETVINKGAGDILTVETQVTLS